MGEKLKKQARVNMNEQIYSKKKNNELPGYFQAVTTSPVFL